MPDSRSNADSYLRTAGYYAERGERLRQSGAAGSNAAGSDIVGSNAVGSDAGRDAYRRALELLLRCRAIATAATKGAADPARLADLALRISEVQRRLGDGGAALGAALEGRRMEPGNTEIDHQIAAILLDRGRAGEAAVALMQGVLLTTDTGLRNELLRLYQGGLDRLGCATMQVPGYFAGNNCFMNSAS